MRRHELHPESFIKINSVKHEGLNCIYCDKLCKNKNSLAQHEIRCNKNPNKLNKFQQAWNKGLTKETDYRIAKISNSVKKAWDDGKFNDVKWENNSHPHSEETKQRLRDVAIERGLGGYTYNKSHEYNGIYFDSKWEVAVAKSLDQNNIRWIRPDRLFYIDNENKQRYYYPDFYLPDYDIYLDPKNDYLLKYNHSGHKYNDTDKINWVMKQNNVIIIILTKSELNWESIKNKITK